MPLKSDESESRSLVHLRIPNSIIERIDAFVKRMRVDVDKIAHKVQVSRNDAAVTLLLRALDEDERSRRPARRAR